jgi:hypothetical protein
VNDRLPPGPFTADDFATVGALVLDAWASGVGLDWSVPAGSLEWSCLFTADHTIDCVFSYALFLGSRKQDTYPNFGELHALPDATPADMIDGLRAVNAMLSGVIAIAPPDATANIFGGLPTVGGPADFAARGADELILHGHDVCAGLGLALDPPADVCRRLLDHTATWPGIAAVERTDDPWGDLLLRSGRSRPG